MPSLKYLLTSVTLAIGLSSSYAAMAKVELVQPNPNIYVIEQNNDANLKDIWARNERDYRQDRRYSHYDDRDSCEERHQARRNERRSSLDKGPYRTSGGFLTGSYGGAGYLDNSTDNNRRGKTTYRDANGHRVGSAYNNGYGQTVYRDKNGRRVALPLIITTGAPFIVTNTAVKLALLLLILVAIPFTATNTAVKSVVQALVLMDAQLIRTTKDVA